MTREQADGDLVSRQAVLDELNKWDWQELYLPIHFKENIIDVVPSVKPQEPCEDAISRQAVLDITWEEPSYTDALNVLTEVRDKVKALPSVKPQEPKTGHWIIYKDCEGKTRQCTCDQCGYKTGKYTWHNPNFCPNCGVDMRGDTDADSD